MDTQENTPAEQPAEPVQANSNPLGPEVEPVTVSTQAADSAENKVEAAAPSGTTVTPAVTAPKAKKKWLPFAIAAGVLALLGGGASAYYFGVYQNPDNVLYDAYSHILSSKASQLKGTATIDMPATMGVTIKSIDYDMNFTNSPGAAMGLTIKATYMGAEVSLNGKGTFTDNGDIYFQLNGMEDTVKSIVKSVGSSVTVPASFYTALEKLQGQWVKVDAADIKKASTANSGDYACIVDAFKKHKNDDTKPYLDAYKKNAFVTKKEDVGTKDGMFGYKLVFDTAKMKAFTNITKDFPLSKDLAACGGSSNATQTVDTAVNDNTSFVFWIDQWSHQLKNVEYSGSNTSGTIKVSYKGNLSIGYDQSVAVTAPSGTISIGEFQTRVQNVIDASGLAGVAASSPAITSNAL